MSGSRSRTLRQKEQGEVPPPAGARQEAQPEDVELIDGVPHVPSDEAARLMDRAAGDWSELMRRLAQ